MKYSGQTTAAVRALVSASSFVSDSMERGDDPERVLQAVSDVTRWSQRLLDDVQTDGASDATVRAGIGGSTLPAMPPLRTSPAFEEAADGVEDMARRLAPASGGANGKK